MKVIVDRDLCAGHGQCVFAAPEIFALDAHGKLVYEPVPGPVVRDKAEEAADACPVQAITIED